MNQKITKVAINRNIIDKNISGNLHFMSKEWENVELPLDEFIKIVTVDGVAFCAQLNGSRSNKNYSCTNLVSIDVDAGTTIKEVLEDEFAKHHLTFYYTTVNHTVEENRFRLGFILERDITDPAEYVAIKRALGLKFCGDPSTFDASRISYGNRSAGYEVFRGSIPCNEIDELIELGRTAPTISETDSITRDFNTGTRRCTKKLPRDFEAQTKAGLLTRLVDLNEQTQIHCRFHKDGNASAFTNKNSRGSTYMFCIVCRTTWWVESEKEEAIRTHDDYEFVKVIKEVREHVKQRAESRSFPEHIDPEKFPLLGTSSIEIVNSQYLEVEGLHNGLTLIRSPKGSGKTESLTEIIRNLVVSKDFRTLEDAENVDSDDAPRSYHSNYKILLIGHRQALIRQLCNRLGLNCYLDDDKFDYQEVKRRRKRYGVCLDSLWKVKEIDYDLVVIDECEQVLAHLLSDTMKRRESIYSMLRYVICSATNVVALDADLGWTSYLTLTEMRGITTPTAAKDNRLWLIINEHIADKSPIEIYSSKEDLIGRMMMDVAENKKLFVAANSKRLVERLHAAIKDKFGEGVSFAVTSANSRTDEAQYNIMNFTETYETYNVVLCSPSLGTGIDITFEGHEQIVDCCYGFFESLINTHLDIDQQIRRVRHPKNVRVWLSPRTFDFETEFGVIKRQLLVDQIIANTFVGFDPVKREQIYNETDPFLTMATHIVSDQRRSQNNLKKNFIDYKIKTGWIPTLVAKNDAFADQGTEFLALGKKLDDEAYAKQILNAKPITKDQFDQIKENLDDDSPLSEESYWSFRRMSLEAFYQSPLSEGIIHNDNRGELRIQFKLFAAVTNTELLNEINKQIRAKYSNNAKTIPFDRIKESDAKIALMHTLLSSTPAFRDGHFDLTSIYTMSDLTEFIRTCKKLSAYVQGQFNHPLRSDLVSKPTTQLHWFLKMVGLSTIKSTKKIGKDKIYQYMIDPDSYNTMVELRTLRESIQDDWVFINQLHGFTPLKPTD
jgi:hypothetical protein